MMSNRIFKQLVCCVSLLTVVFPGRVAAAVAPDDVATLPSISALHVRRHEKSDVVLLEARVDLSPAGLRVRQNKQRIKLEMRQDFVAGRAFLIDLERRISFEILMSDQSADSGTEFAMPSGAERVGATEFAAQTGLLSTTPCGNQSSVRAGSGIWRGRQVQRFQCFDYREQLVADELMDLEFGIVLYRRTLDGVVDELRELRPRNHPMSIFTSPSRFRIVDKRELIHGAPALPVFNDSGVK